MSIRRTRQQKMNAELKHDGGSLRYQPSKEGTLAAQTAVMQPSKGVKNATTRYFLMDMQKTAVSTLIVLIMLGVTFWLLR